MFGQLRLYHDPTRLSDVSPVSIVKTVRSAFTYEVTQSTAKYRVSTIQGRSRQSK